MRGNDRGAAGPGFELAGAIAELARHGMTGEFREIDPAQARVILVQSGNRVLPTFPISLSAATQRSLAALGVEVRLSSRVESIDAHGVTVSGVSVAARTVLWAAGVTASPAAEWLGVASDKVGRVKVGANLEVPGMAGIYVIGDTAASNAWTLVRPSTAAFLSVIASVIRRASLKVMRECRAG